MILPKNGRMFVDGMAPGTGEVDLLRYFLYGEIADIWFLTDQFAVVQFFRPCAARHAILANLSHRINSERVYVGRAHPKLYNPKPLLERIFRSGGSSYRVGDRVRLSAAPAPGFFYSVINYIAVDGTLAWSQVQSSDATAGISTPDNSFFSDFAQFSSNSWQHCQRPGDGGRASYQERSPRGPPTVPCWCFSGGVWRRLYWTYVRPSAEFTYPTTPESGWPKRCVCCCSSCEGLSLFSNFIV